MRIGIDMIGVQSGQSHGRGIGRYARSLVSALLRVDAGIEYRLYGHDALPTDGLPDAPNSRLVVLSSEKTSPPFDRLLLTNPDGLDALLLLSPFEQYGWYGLPARPVGGLPVVSVVYDLIPFLFQERYLNDPDTAPRNYRKLETIRGHDALLTISEATRADVLRVLGLPGDRVFTIGGATEPGAFWLDRREPMPAVVRHDLLRIGVRRPFVFSVAGADSRKNPLGLVSAFGLLPRDMRAAHQLVISCYLSGADRQAIRRHAERHGLSDLDLVLTGEVEDATLRNLYQRCAAFVLPSKYEGLGLPLIEAMACGAAVIAGNNSSQVEVVGDAGLLVNAESPSDIAGRIAEVLRDADFARDLGARGLERSALFTWEKTARRAVDALSRVAGRRSRARKEKPRVAVFSPWPPKASGVSAYADRLVHELQGRYAIDLFHDSGYVPEVALGSADFACHDHRLFRRVAASKHYHGVLYQMGNSHYHEFLYNYLIEFPGVVTLHDLNLAAFHFDRVHRTGSPMDAFHDEVAYCHAGQADGIVARLGEWSGERGGLPQAFPRRGLHLNRRVLAHADAVVVHSAWCVEQVRRDDPDLVGKMVVIPMGATPRTISVETRAAIRVRFHLPPEALILGAFGILSQSKMNVEAIEAFRALALERPDSLFVLAGEDYEDGEAQRRVEELGLDGRVVFLGRVTDADFADLIAAVDVGICLRRPPTYGETSAALLDLLRHGVPTIVTDVATFADYPDAVVRKVRWPAEGLDGLTRAVLDLAAAAEARESLGRAALRYVRENHSWSGAAASYAEVLDRLAAGSQRAGMRPIQMSVSPWSRSA